MRENPNLSEADTDYVGDSAMARTGDANEFLKAQVFAWEQSKIANRSDDPNNVAYGASR